MTRKLTAGQGSLGRYGARFCLSLVVALLVALPWPARADYVPQRGDVLDILVSGVPALKFNALLSIRMARSCSPYLARLRLRTCL